MRNIDILTIEAIWIIVSDKVGGTFLKMMYRVFGASLVDHAPARATA
jgi:hypothetical protein